jgi:uncharacterized iron-regulated protein
MHFRKRLSNNILTLAIQLQTMIAKKTLGLLTLVLILFSFNSDKRAFCIYKQTAKKSSYSKLIKEAEKADIILFGELHNNSIAHWLQIELVQELHKTKKSNLVLGAEMFEADNQVLITEYLSGLHSTKTFEKESKLWPNYKTDYKPLLEFAKANSLHFVASNIPRRYASLVYKKGLVALDSISDEAKNWIAPLPIKYDSSLACYQNILKMAGGHGGQRLPMAQAAKDATMAYFILQNYSAGNTFIHFNGSYHSNNFESIYWYLRQAKPDLNIMTINCVEQEALDSLEVEYKNTADFIIAIPANMTKTY